MSWLYLLINAAVLAAAAILGWRSRKLRGRHFVMFLAAAGLLMIFRTWLHAHPEHEQLFLGISYDYVFFATWEAPLTAFMSFALAGRLASPRVRRVAVTALALGGPAFLWSNLVPCLQPAYAMAARFDEDYVCRQTTDYSCGPAAAVTMLKRFGYSVSEGEMARLCLLRRNEGVTMLDLCRGLSVALEPSQRRAHIQRLTSDDLAAVGRPFLAEIRRPSNAEHCVVVLQVAADAVVIADPAYGKRILTRAEFERQWTGLVITVTPAVHPPSRQPVLARIRIN